MSAPLGIRTNFEKLEPRARPKYRLSCASAFDKRPVGWWSFQRHKEEPSPHYRGRCEPVVIRNRGRGPPSRSSLKSAIRSRSLNGSIKCVAVVVCR